MLAKQHRTEVVTARDVGNSNRQSGWLLPSTWLMQWLTKLNTAVDSSDDDTNKHTYVAMDAVNGMAIKATAIDTSNDN